MNKETVFPQDNWQRTSPREVGFSAQKLGEVEEWFEEESEGSPYRVVIVREGRIVDEWYQGMEKDQLYEIASATKSVFSCMLGIAIEEGKVASADERLVDYYPEAMEVPEGEGPKENRYAFPVNERITFRQLISNTSGYMKPGEAPGQVFHYQTYGMNVLIHAIAKAYDLYDVDKPEKSPGLRKLIDEKLKVPLGAEWDYYLHNFDLHSEARINIFGYYEGIKAHPLDLARLGLLWEREGRWEGGQLVPRDWLREATAVAAPIRENCPQEEWKYGYGFWTNEYGLLWPDLPRSSYAAIGAGKNLIWIEPGLDLVVVLSPGLWEEKEDFERPLVKILEACQT